LTQDQVVREAKKRAPIGTPKTTGIPDYIVAHSYQKSIRREPPTKQGGKFTAPVVAGRWIINPNTGREVDYALPLERGKSGQAPEGVMEVSLMSQIKYFRNQIRKGVRRALK